MRRSPEVVRQELDNFFVFLDLKAREYQRQLATLLAEQKQDAQQFQAAQSKKRYAKLLQQHAEAQSYIADRKSPHASTHAQPEQKTENREPPKDHTSTVLSWEDITQILTPHINKVADVLNLQSLFQGQIPIALHDDAEDASAIEALHQAVVNLPIQVLEQTQVLMETARLAFHHLTTLVPHAIHQREENETDESYHRTIQGAFRGALPTVTPTDPHDAVLHATRHLILQRAFRTIECASAFLTHLQAAHAQLLHPSPHASVMNIKLK